METSKRLDGIGEYYFSQKLREIAELNKAGKDIINLGIGSPDLPPHPDVIKVLHDESLKEKVHGYQPYKGSPVLRNAISKWYKKYYQADLDPNTEIFPLIGSKEGIVHICMTYINEGDQVLVPNPGYPTYGTAVKLAGGIAVEYQLDESNSWYPDFNRIEQQDLSRLRMMFVNYPHMPSGQPADKKIFEKLVQFAKQHSIILVHDNPYSFILNDLPLSLLNIDGAKDVVIELNSLSKSHNMAGWRVGMVCAAKNFIDDIIRFKSNMDSGMFMPVQLAAAKALELDHNWYDSINKIYRLRREYVEELLLTIGCEFSTAQQGMFMWAKVPNKYKDGYALSDELLYQKNVFITPGGIFGSAGNQYVRVSLCTPVEKIIEAITRIKSHE
jgi:aspartate/methionine/tyrosine aminotransferase